MAKLRVILLDPHPATARALASLLAEDPSVGDVTLVGDLGPEGALRRCRRADVVVADAGLLHAHGSVLRLLPADVALVVLDTGGQAAFATAARRRGATYLRKEQAAERLGPLLAVLAGGGLP